MGRKGGTGRKGGMGRKGRKGRKGRMGLRRDGRGQTSVDIPAGGG
jgi:hypothetical protein